MKVLSRLNVGSKSSWGNSKNFGKNTIIWNKQSNLNKLSKQRQTKSLLHKAKSNRTQPNCVSEPQAEWMPHQNKTKMQNVRNRKMKTSEETRFHIKKLIKNPNAKLWVNSVLAWRTEILGPDCKKKHQTKTFRHGQQFPSKESKVSSQTRNWNPSALRP